jgi:hypothetical protein
MMIEQDNPIDLTWENIIDEDPLILYAMSRSLHALQQHLLFK